MRYEPDTTRAKRWTGRILLTLVAAVTTILASPAAADAATATWSITPSSAEGGDQRVSVRATLEAGAVHADHVQISNLSDSALSLTLAGADGLVTPDGDFDVAADGETSTAAGRWIQIEPRITVEPRSSAVVPFTVTVPPDALPGDHPAGIVAALAPEHAAAGGVAFIVRTGVRLHLRVAGEIAPALTPTVTDVAYEPQWNPFAPGRLRVSWEIVNTGNVRLGGSPALAVTGPFGIAPQVEDQMLDQFRELLPGDSREGSVVVEAWPLFALGADVQVAPNVVGEDEISVALPTGSASATAIAVPWVQLAILLVLAAIVVFLVRRRRAAHRAAGARSAPSGDAGPSSGDSEHAAPEPEPARS